MLNQTWALDFMRDTLYDGRVFRTLNVLDHGNREALAIEVGMSLPSRRVLIGRQALFDVIVDGMRQAGTIFTPEQIEEFSPALRVAFNINRLLAARPVAGFNPNY